MKTSIYLKTSLFPPYPDEEEDINPGRFGKRLGEFVKDVLEKNGIEVADLYATDSCYELRIDQFDFPVYIQTGNLDGEKTEFLISIEPKKPFVRKWFRKIPTAPIVEQLSTALLQACEENDKIAVVE